MHPASSIVPYCLLSLQSATSSILVEAAPNRACGQCLPKWQTSQVSPQQWRRRGPEEATCLGQPQVIPQTSSKCVLLTCTQIAVSSLEADGSTMLAFSFLPTWVQRASLVCCYHLSQPAMILTTSDTWSSSYVGRRRKTGMGLTQFLVLCLQHCLTWQLPPGMSATHLWTNSRSVPGGNIAPKLCWAFS